MFLLMRIKLLQALKATTPSTNAVVFMLTGLTTTGLGIKSLFYWSEQMPSMLKLLLVSADTAQAYKTYNRRLEFRADQNVLVLNENPRTLH
jgi:hypothetical protein